VLVTCGYIMEKPMQELTPFVDGANIDLKGFSEEFYMNVTGGRLKPVLDCIKYMHAEGVIVEVTNLVVPTLNDDMSGIKSMCTWLCEEVSPEVPLHFSRFQPQYKLANLPATPYATLDAARAVALEVGLKYVYVGNVPHADAQQTVCPQCKATVIKRMGYTVLDNKVSAGTCTLCGGKIHGIFD